MIANCIVDVLNSNILFHIKRTCLCKKNLKNSIKV